MSAIACAIWAQQPLHKFDELDRHCTSLMSLTAIKPAQTDISQAIRVQQPSHKLNKLNRHHTSSRQAQQALYELNMLKTHLISIFVAQAWPHLHELESHCKRSTAITGAWLLLLELNDLVSHCTSSIQCDWACLNSCTTLTVIVGGEVKSCWVVQSEVKFIFTVNGYHCSNSSINTFLTSIQKINYSCKAILALKL